MTFNFRETIRREAKRRGLSGYALGKLAGIPIRTVQDYLSESSDLAGRRLEKLCAVLNLGLRRIDDAKRSTRKAR